LRAARKKLQIPRTKTQTISKPKVPITKTSRLLFCDFLFGHCELFGIWCLGFGACGASRVSTKIRRCWARGGNIECLLAEAGRSYRETIICRKCKKTGLFI
jgi:hypothetical protein